MSFTDYLAAIGHGAAAVYHAALATGVAVVSWEATHPEIAPLLSQGASAANTLLLRAVPEAGVAEVVGADVLVALKSMAAADATVPSRPGIISA